MRWRNKFTMALIVWWGFAGMAKAGEVRLPDTGQTTSHTNTVGEDHDTRRPRSYTINTNGTVIDNVTRLMWQQRDESGYLTWAEAGIYCAGLTLAGFTDWRLPTDQELQTIIYYDSIYPEVSAIDETAFSVDSNLWSSTSTANDAGTAWAVDSAFGHVEREPKGNHLIKCLCVRRLQ